METNGKPFNNKSHRRRNPNINPNPRLLSDEEKRLATINRLADIVSYKISKDCSNPISPELRSQIVQRLREFYPSLQSPSHPPYSMMIQQAILDLDEEYGSSEKAIGDFIIKEYENLAWAHFSLLSHHLEKLCCDGEIIRTEKGNYVSASASPYACDEDLEKMEKMDEKFKNTMQIENNENIIKGKGKQKLSDVSKQEGKLEMPKKSKSGGQGIKRKLI